MNLDFDKNNGLIPAIIQDSTTHKVLMLGFMNAEAYQKTVAENRVTFFSRTKNRLWTKGEESGHFLTVVSILADCDNDTLLIKAQPQGPVCHMGTDTCWGETNTAEGYPFLSHLTQIIKDRKEGDPSESYTAKMFDKGLNKIAQKVGEEATELIIEAKDNNPNLFVNEAADLLFHYMMLLEAKGITLTDVEAVLKERHK